MGYIYKFSSADPDKINTLLFPIIFCLDKVKVSKYLEEYKILSLNGILSKRLLSFDEDKYHIYVIDEINEIIQSKEGPLLITDFEMLFNPTYQIDVLKLFISLNRRKKLVVLWPGRYEKDELKFAEPGYQDYNTYNINNYDITCII